MGLLMRAHEEVGGEVISAGGTGTYDINTWATEIQAGSYALMDTAYAKLGLPFVHALSVLSTVISVSKDWVVADCGLKALGMDHGNPSVEGSAVWFCSDEHLTWRPGPRCGWANGCGYCRRTSIRRSRITSICTSSTARTWWTAGTSTCAGGEGDRLIQNSSTSRPRTPPASSRRCASGAWSAGNVRATRSVSTPASACARSASSLACSWA